MGIKDKPHWRLVESRFLSAEASWNVSIAVIIVVLKVDCISSHAEQSILLNVKCGISIGLMIDPSKTVALIRREKVMDITRILHSVRVALLNSNQTQVASCVETKHH